MRLTLKPCYITFVRNGNLSKNSTCGKLLPWQRSQTRANVTLLNIFYGVGVRELIVAPVSLKNFSNEKSGKDFCVQKSIFVSDK